MDETIFTCNLTATLEENIQSPRWHDANNSINIFTNGIRVGIVKLT